MPKRRVRVPWNRKIVFGQGVPEFFAERMSQQVGRGKAFDGCLFNNGSVLKDGYPVPDA